MKPHQSRIFCVILFLFSTLNPVHAREVKKAVIVGDEIRVRVTPSVRGKYAGILYNNMLVEILEQSDKKVQIGEELKYWYKVKLNNIEGWIYGQFLSLDIPSGYIDTYETTGDIQWFYKRFGYSTNFLTSKINVNTFDTEEYRKLIKSLENGTSYEHAAIALHSSILPHLKAHPNDLKYAYLKEKLYSDDILKKIIRFSSRENINNNIPIIDNEELIKEIIKLRPHALSVASEKLKDKPEVIDIILNKDVAAFKYASIRLKSDKAYMLSAVKKNSFALSHASDSLKNDRDILLAALKKGGRAIRFVSEELRTDYDIIVAAITSWGPSLKYASEEIKNNKKVVLIAVKNNGQALQYANSQLRADKEVVLAAVATTPYSLKFASDDLRANKEVILTSIHYAKPNMSNHIRYALEQLGEKEFPTIIDIIIKQQQNIYKPNVSRHYKSHLAIGMVPKDFWAYESFVSNFSKAWHSNNFRDCFYSSYIDNGLITNNSFIIKLSKLNPYCVSNNKIINQENN